MKKNRNKVLIFKINLCDKIFSYSSAYALMLESISEAVSSFCCICCSQEGEQEPKKESERVFIVPSASIFHTTHSMRGYHSAALVSIYLRELYFLLSGSCWMDASLYCIFALRARCWYYLIWIPIANICLASGQWPRAEMMISADCAATETDCARLPIDGLKK